MVHAADRAWVPDYAWPSSIEENRKEKSGRTM